MNWVMPKNLTLKQRAMPDLPPEIVDEILSRLPVKPLLRFRCLSRPWCALIDSPNFIKMHLTRSIQTRNTMRIILTYTPDDRIYSIDFDSLDRAVEIDHPLRSKKHLCSPTQVWGSCNGLLCLVDSQEEICVWNPSTKKHWKLPVTPFETRPPFCNKKTVVYGFGFDSMSDDYKVVRIVLFQGERVLLGSEVKVYSFKSNLWRRVEDFPHYFDLEFIIPGWLARGALHWEVAVIPEDRLRSIIIAFDLGAESFQIVTQPDYKEPKFYSELGVLEGFLCVTACHPERFDIWVMEEYGVKESWAKLISIKQSDLGGSVYCLMPIAFSKNCGKLLVEHDSIKDDTQRFSWYDLKRQIIERVKICDIPNDFITLVCWGSLVRLGGCS